MLAYPCWRSVLIRRPILKRLAVQSQAVCNARWVTNQPTDHAATKHLDSETTGYQIGSVFGNMRQNIAKYMAKSLASKNLYESCADKIDYNDFFKACNMPDTFQSWFYVMHLHIWMLLVRLRLEDSPGKSLSYNMVEIMWQDVEQRMKLIGLDDASSRRENLEEFAQQFFGMIVAYDEGLLGHDRVLASALWRNLFYNKPNTDAEKLALIVGYVRKQVQFLENQPSADIMLEGKVKWLPLNEPTVEDEAESEQRFVDP